MSKSNALVDFWVSQGVYCGHSSMLNKVLDAYKTHKKKSKSTPKLAPKVEVVPVVPCTRFDRIEG